MKDKVEQLARGMYDEYCTAVGGKSFNGETLPKSEEFFNDGSKVVQANAWRANAEYAMRVLAQTTNIALVNDSLRALAMVKIHEYSPQLRANIEAKIDELLNKL